jgi:hypothetical protein
VRQTFKTIAMKGGKKTRAEIFKPGRIGEVVFYEREGKKFSRIYQPVVKQTQATRDAAKIFGRAMIYAKHLRKGIISIMHDPKDRQIIYKMNNAVYTWLKSPIDPSGSQDRIADLSYLDINAMRRIRFQVQVDWSVAGTVSIKFPSFNPLEKLGRKAGTTHLRWKIAVAGVTTDFVPRAINGCQTTFTTAYRDTDLPGKTVEIPYTRQPGSINIVALSLSFCFDNRETRQKLKTWEPEGLISAHYQA